MTPRLHPDDLAALAEMVADNLAERLADQSPSATLTAGQVAARLGVTREYVYRHQADLGAHRLGDGTKGRLRFRAEDVDAYLTAQAKPAKKAPKRRPPRRRRARTDVPLLPVKGRVPQ